MNLRHRIFFLFLFLPALAAQAETDKPCKSVSAIHNIPVNLIEIEDAGRIIWNGQPMKLAEFIGFLKQFSTMKKDRPYFHVLWHKAGQRQANSVLREIRQHGLVIETNCNDYFPDQGPMSPPHR